MTKIYVGNLPYSATEDELRELFSAHGEVSSVSLVNDRETGRPRGFGFVEMAGEEAEAAIQALDGSQMGGRTLKVNEARPREKDDGERDLERHHGVSESHVMRHRTRPAQYADCVRLHGTHGWCESKRDSSHNRESDRKREHPEINRQIYQP